MEKVTEKKKDKRKLFLVLKILFAIIYVTVTVLLIVGYVNAVTAGEDKKGELLAFLIFGVIILGTLGYIISLIPAVIGMALSVIFQAKISHKIFFCVAIFLTVLTEAVFIVLCRVSA
ncbi:MAG: hypothetical protein IJV83_04080 [Clostridia bacterium]|nr:hypothetical protein [Clostridia bacterium]